MGNADAHLLKDFRHLGIGIEKLATADNRHAISNRLRNMKSFSYTGHL
ncbi:MAG: hypothetical protein ACHBN1_33010 [Heteroscytonema crispum UTEX LB 1556]